MKYLFLIYEDQKVAERLTKDDVDRINNEYYAFMEENQKNGRLLGGDQLQSAERTTTVRVRDGRTAINDRPLAEDMEEELGGYFLVEARDRSEAIELAAKIPTARTGSIEVRPIMPQ